MIELKYASCGNHTLRCLVVSATNGEQPVLDTNWISTGGSHPPIASLDKIKLLVVFFLGAHLSIADTVCNTGNILFLLFLFLAG